MRDYMELVEALREHSKKDSDCELCPYTDAEDRGYTTCSEELTSNAANAIEELSKPKWISVEDALPEEDVEVLISYRYKEGEGDTSHVDIDITTYGQMYFGGREVAGVKHWRPPFEYFSSNYEVIAWMPLPEPPKEEQP